MFRKKSDSILALAAFPKLLHNNPTVFISTFADIARRIFAYHKIISAIFRSIIKESGAFARIARRSQTSASGKNIFKRGKRINCGRAGKLRRDRILCCIAHIVLRRGNLVADLCYVYLTASALFRINTDTYPAVGGIKAGAMLRLVKHFPQRTACFRIIIIYLFAGKIVMYHIKRRKTDLKLSFVKQSHFQKASPQKSF